MWVRFFVQGKSRAETYRWIPDNSTDASLRAEAETWADGTSQGQLNDHFTYGFDRVRRLPKKVRADLIEIYAAKKQYAEDMLKILIPALKKKR